MWAIYDERGHDKMDGGAHIKSTPASLLVELEVPALTKADLSSALSELQFVGLIKLVPGGYDLAPLGKEEKEEPHETFNYRAVFEGLEHTLGCALTWNFGKEVAMIRDIRKRYPTAEVADFVDFIVYKRALFRADPHAVPTFSKSYEDFGAWWAAGKPKQEKGVVHGAISGTSAKRGVRKTRSESPRGSVWDRLERSADDAPGHPSGDDPPGESERR